MDKMTCPRNLPLDKERALCYDQGQRKKSSTFGAPLICPLPLNLHQAVIIPRGGVENVGLYFLLSTFSGDPFPESSLYQREKQIRNNLRMPLPIRCFMVILLGPSVGGPF